MKQSKTYSQINEADAKRLQVIAQELGFKVGRIGRMIIIAADDYEEVLKEKERRHNARRVA